MTSEKTPFITFTYLLRIMSGSFEIGTREEFSLYVYVSFISLNILCIKYNHCIFEFTRSPISMQCRSEEKFVWVVTEIASYLEHLISHRSTRFSNLQKCVLCIKTTENIYTKVPLHVRFFINYNIKTKLNRNSLSSHLNCTYLCILIKIVCLMHIANISVLSSSSVPWDLKIGSKKKKSVHRKKRRKSDQRPKNVKRPYIVFVVVPRVSRLVWNQLSQWVLRNQCIGRAAHLVDYFQERSNAGEET